MIYPHKVTPNPGSYVEPAHTDDNTVVGDSRRSVAAVGDAAHCATSRAGLRLDAKGVGAGGDGVSGNGNGRDGDVGADGTL